MSNARPGNLPTRPQTPALKRVAAQANKTRYTLAKSPTQAKMSGTDYHGNKRSINNDK